MEAGRRPRHGSGSVGGGAGRTEGALAAAALRGGGFFGPGGVGGGPTPTGGPTLPRPQLHASPNQVNSFPTFRKITSFLWNTDVIK